MADDLCFKYQVHDEMQNICRRYMNLCLNFNEIPYIVCCLDTPVTRITAVCGAHKDINVLRLLLKKKLDCDQLFNYILHFLQMRNIKEITICELDRIFSEDFPIHINYRMHFSKALINNSTFESPSMFNEKYPLSNVRQYLRSIESLIEEALTEAVFQFRYSFIENLHSVLKELNISYTYSQPNNSSSSIPTVNSKPTDLLEWLQEAYKNYSKLLESDCEPYALLDCEKTLNNFVKYYF